jgi:glycosyltransferase involved in cell wall biosynthesis
MFVTLDLTIMVLTLDEQRHIERCLESARPLARRLVVVDSGSTDDTTKIASRMGAEVYKNSWTNYATQFNWALDHCKIDTEWVIRLDADEVITEELARQLANAVPLQPRAVAGVTVNRRIHFMGKWIRHGGIYPVQMLRLWRNGRGRCENRWMDEHMVVDGSIVHIDADIADINLNNITWWIAKHNKYASREAIDVLVTQSLSGGRDVPRALGRQARTKRWFKEAVYARLPLGGRALMYFCYRYFLRLGFLDGWRGLIFHALQGLWYRFLVDVKIYELRSLMTKRNQSLAEVAYAEYGYDISARNI